MSSHRGYAHLNHQIHRQAVCSEVLLAWFMTFKNVKILYVRYMSDICQIMSDICQIMSDICQLRIWCVVALYFVYNNLQQSTTTTTLKVAWVTTTPVVASYLLLFLISTRVDLRASIVARLRHSADLNVWCPNPCCAVRGSCVVKPIKCPNICMYIYIYVNIYIYIHIYIIYIIYIY